MNKKLVTFMALPAILLASSCKSEYTVTDVSRTRILIDNHYDDNSDKEAVAFLSPYKCKVDSMMSPVVGTVSKYMAAHRPESELSNLVSDILMWGGKEFNEKPDFAVYNMGGIRAALPQGNITYGDIVNIAPFENKICFVTLSGENALKLFRQIAASGGEGVSHGIEMVISKDRKLIDVKLNGEEIVPDKSYRVVTIDYIAQGNDGMDAFKSGTDVLSPQDKKNDSRFIIIDYFKEQASKGVIVDPHVEGRIVEK
nr:5'-nucleotidase C-terminal domain-containing protein [Prevotella sp.]